MLEPTLAPRTRSRQARLRKSRPAPRPIRRALLVSSGHNWSTADAFTGLHAGLTAAGVESWPFDVAARMDLARELIMWRDGQEVAAGRRDAAREMIDVEREAIAVVGQEAVIQALAVGADAVIVVSALLFDPRIYMLMSRARIPVFVFGTESPYHDDFYADVVPMTAAFSVNDTSSLGRFRALVEGRGSDTRVLYLPLGYDPVRHYRGVGDGTFYESHDVVFVGNVYPSRQTMMEGIDWTGIDLGLYGVFVTMTDDSPLWRHVKTPATPEMPVTPIDNRATAALYDRAKIVLNLFRTEVSGLDPQDRRTIEGAESINPRLLEAAACGAFMISEWRPEVETMFGDLVPTFRTPLEAERLIRYYLEHDDEREAIRAKLPAAVAAHSYHVRARQIVDVLADVRAKMA